MTSWLHHSIQPALAGDEVPFLEADSFIPYLKTVIVSHSVNTASVFSINAMIPAVSIAEKDASCTPDELVPYLAKIIRWILSPSGIILRVGPGILVCVHLSHRSVDPELIGLQVERSIKRIFKIPAEAEGILKGSFRFDPRVAESEESLLRFLSSL